MQQIYSELAHYEIIPTRWELEALVRGAKVSYGDKHFCFPTFNEWAGFDEGLELAYF